MQRRWATGAQGLVHGCGPYSLPPGPSKGPGETKNAPPRGAEGGQDQGGMGVAHPSAAVVYGRYSLMEQGALAARPQQEAMA